MTETMRAAIGNSNDDDDNNDEQGRRQRWMRMTLMDGRGGHLWMDGRGRQWTMMKMTTRQQRWKRTTMDDDDGDDNG